MRAVCRGAETDRIRVFVGMNGLSRTTNPSAQLLDWADLAWFGVLVNLVAQANIKKMMGPLGRRLAYVGSSLIGPREGRCWSRVERRSNRHLTRRGVCAAPRGFTRAERRISRQGPMAPETVVEISRVTTCETSQLRRHYLTVISRATLA